MSQQTKSSKKAKQHPRPEVSGEDEIQHMVKRLRLNHDGDKASDENGKYNTRTSNLHMQKRWDCAPGLN